MRKILEYLDYVVDRLWNDQPWIKSLTIVGFIVWGVSVLTSYMEVDFGQEVSKANIRIVLIAVVISLYFLVTAVIASLALSSERRLQRTSKEFRYDRGTLYNGNQPNIAFRVITFQGLLGSIASFFGNKQTSEAFLVAGEKAARNFSETLPQIYNDDVHANRGGQRWEDLFFEDKLAQWAEYDSRTGWGYLVPEWNKKDIVSVSVTHLKGLFQGEGGVMFAYFLAGYCQTVLRGILQSERGRVGQFQEAQLEPMNADGISPTVEFRYRLS